MIDTFESLANAYKIPVEELRGVVIDESNLETGEKHFSIFGDSEIFNFLVNEPRYQDYSLTHHDEEAFYLENFGGESEKLEDAQAFGLDKGKIVFISRQRIAV